MDFREYIKNNILKKNNRIIEFGPLNRPVAKKEEFSKAFYADIKNRNEIVELYTDNNYLKSTGIFVDVESIVNIDYVVKENYKNTFKKVKKFDISILSHVVEHMPNLLYFFKDIENILKDGSKLILIYPDCRYCFDHFRNETSFRDAYSTYIEGNNSNARLGFDFTFNVIKENDAAYFWNSKNLTDRINKNNFNGAEESYKSYLENKSLEDVHYWPFSDYGFLKFLFEAKKSKLINFNLLEFYPTQKNTQEFMVILEYNKKENNYENILKLMNEYDPNTIKNIDNEKIENLIKENNDFKEDLTKKENIIINIEKELTKKENTIINIEKELKDKEKSIETLIKEINNILNSKSWKITKPLRKISSLVRNNKNEEK